MKKRVLSFLLLFAMLVTMVPTMALGAAAETGDEELPRSEAQITSPISDYDSLYKTEGLIAFFDALDPENGTLDLAEGKWYARVYDAETKRFVISTTLFATVKGGAYDADANPTGWQAYESGFGYADADLTATENVIEFNKDALLSYEKEAGSFARYSNWTVEALVRADLRNIADKDGRVENSFLFGPVGATHWTNLATEDTNGGKGSVRWSLLPKSGSSLSAIEIAGASTAASASFVTYNGKIAPITVSKIAVNANESRYTVTHGDFAFSSSANASNADYEDAGLHVLKNEQGVVYAVRVYASEKGEALTAAEAAANSTVDTLIRLGVSLDVFNTMVEYKGLVERFLSEIAPTYAKDATKEDYETAIAALVEDEKRLAKAKKLSDYEALYVGADGSLTENGGKLVALFSVTDESLNLTTGEWINKIGSVNASLGNAGRWQKREDGGIGYDVLYGQFVNGELKTDVSTNTVATGSGSGSSVHLKTRLNLGLALLPKEDFTIEYTAKYNPIYVANADGTVATNADGTPVEYYVANKNNGISNAEYSAALDYIGFISSWTVSRDGAHATYMPARGDVIWMLTDKTPSWGQGNSWVGSRPLQKGGGLLASGIREYGKVHTYVYTRDETLTVGSSGDRTVNAVYSVLRDGVRYTTSPVLSTANLAAADTNGDGKHTVGENWGTVYYDKDDVGNFYLSSGIPTDFYKVRIYDGVLTQSELTHNAFIDMAEYAKADLTVYNGLDERIVEFVEGDMLAKGFAGDALAFAANLAQIIESYRSLVMPEDTLYVTDGLRVLTTAYSGLDTGAVLSENGSGVSLYNAVRWDEKVTLKGAEWQRRANNLGGGYYLLKQVTKTTPVADRSFGVYLTPQMLPEASYSLELIVNPTGSVVINEDGTYERYVDSVTTYGVYYENGFMIGPLRCMIFPTQTDGGGRRAGLEKRWCYDQGVECWENTNTRNHKTTENAWRFTNLDDVVTYSIDYERLSEAGKGRYTFYNDYENIAAFNIEEKEFITNAKANNAFQLMVGMPGGVFSVRVYNRVLTDAEKIQNHAADLVYYYDLNTDFLDQVLSYFEDDPTIVFRGFSDLGFDMAKDEAQAIFDARLCAIWLGFEEVGIRNDYTEGLRYYFTMDETTATTMIREGFKIEIGAIVNVGQNARPTLDGYNYDYKIVAYDSVGGKNAGFFIDENTFAVTVKAASANKLAMLTQLSVLGYVRLTDADGKVIDYYVDTAYDHYTPDSFFSVYNYMMKKGSPVKDVDLRDHLETITDGCYEKEYIYLNAGAGTGGNGTKDAPYSDFETAFAAAKAKLPDINKPTNLYLMAADGVYEMRDIVTLDGSEMPYEYARLVITSENGKSTLTSNKVIDSNGFVKTEGSVWTYQFTADANGEYPYFRYLYVNGKIADMAHNGANNMYTADETRYMTQFYRWEITPWLNAKYMWEAGKLKHDTLYYPLEKVALNSSFAHYRDQYLVYEDISYLGKNILPTTQPKAKNASTYYLELFETNKHNKLIYGELESLYYDIAKEDKDAFLAAAQGYTSSYTEESLLKADKEAYDAAKAAYDAAIAQYAEGSAEYLAAVADFAAAEAKYQAAKAPLDAYTAALAAAIESVTSAMKSNKTFASAISAYTLKNPTSNYPNENLFFYKEWVVENWPGDPSGGMLELVNALREGNELTHASLPNAGDKNTVVELQFLYYRDAYLALDEVNALETLSFDATPSEANGSDQYKALFYEYLYTKMAIAELAAVASAEGSTKSAVAGYETAFENAPEGYKEILTEIRDAQMLADPAEFADFSSYQPAVRESDAPYEGKVPCGPMMDQYKAYLNVELVGEQDVAIANGRAKLEETAMKMINDAVAKYRAAYNALVEVTATYESLDAEGQRAYNEFVVNARKDAKAAYEDCQKQLAIASRYLSDEYDEAYILEGAGIQLAMATEWQYNIVYVTGVDYDDKIVKDGKTHVAVYCDPEQYEAFSLLYEKHFYNRMASLMSSSAYLDKNNEYYYDQEHGTLYYYNEGGIDGLKFEYPTMNNMIYLSNVKNLIVDSMTFTGLDYDIVSLQGYTAGQAGSDNHVDVVGEESVMPSGAPIYGKMIYGVTVRNSTFHDLACEAISFRGRIEDTTVEDCTFTSIGSAGVRFGEVAGWSDSLGAEGCTVTNNYFDGIAQLLYASPAIMATYAKDLEISYNTIRNTSYTGISVGWNWSASNFMYGDDVKLMHVDIHHNYVESVMQQLGDGGHIYTVGGNAAKEETTLFNWCHDNYLVFTNTTGDGEGRLHAAIYHDGSSSHWETYNNVIVAHSFGASGPTTSSSSSNVYQTAVETVDDALFDTINTPFTMEEYQLRLRKNRNASHIFFVQGQEDAEAYNITIRDNVLVNTRSTKATGTAVGTQFYEAYRDCVSAEYLVFVENMTYVGDPMVIPVEVEDIIKAAGSYRKKGNPFAIADNNY